MRHMYTATQAAQVFKVSRETVRRWSSEFKAFLSPTANPEKDRQRAYTDSDMEVFALVAEQKAQGRLFEDIKAALGAGQRGSAPADAAAIVQSDAPRATALQARVANLEKALTHSEARREELQKQLDDTKRELRDAYKQIGRLEAGE